MKYILDLKTIKSREELHTALAEKMGFPSYYGKNLDALYDVLTEDNDSADVVFLNSSFTSPEVSDTLQKMKKVFMEAKCERPGLFFRIFEKEEKKIQTVIFDIGNVLIKFDGLDFLKEKYGDEMGLKIANAMYGDNRWSELDRGVLSMDELFQTFFDADPEVPREYIRWSFDHISRAIFRCDYAIPWLREVKALGIKVLYLSNYSRPVMAAKPEVLDFLPVMDGGVFSCDAKLIKPDRAIYSLIIEKYVLDPVTCLFIDDRQDNCETASLVGMNYHCFRDYAKDKDIIMDFIG